MMSRGDPMHDGDVQPAALLGSGMGLTCDNDRNIDAAIPDQNDTHEHWRSQRTFDHMGALILGLIIASEQDQARCVSKVAS
jgi:hypothetical protein